MRCSILAGFALVSAGCMVEIVFFLWGEQSRNSDCRSRLKNMNPSEISKPATSKKRYTLPKGSRNFPLATTIWKVVVGSISLMESFECKFTLS